MAEYDIETALAAAVRIYTINSNGTTSHGSGGLVKGEHGMYVGTVAHNALDPKTAEVKSRLTDESGAYFIVSKAGYIGIARAQLLQYSAPCDSSPYITHDHMGMEVLPFEKALEVFKRFEGDGNFLASLDRAGKEAGIEFSIPGFEYGIPTHPPKWYVTNSAEWIDLRDLNNANAYAPNEAYLVAGFPAEYREHQMDDKGVRHPETRICQATGLKMNPYSGAESSVTYTCIEDGITADNTIKPGSSGGFTYSQNPYSSDWKIRGVHSIFAYEYKRDDPAGEYRMHSEGSSVAIAPLYDLLQAMDDARGVGEAVQPQLLQDKTLDPYDALMDVCVEDVHIADLPAISDQTPLALRGTAVAESALRGRFD